MSGTTAIVELSFKKNNCLEYVDQKQRYKDRYSLAIQLYDVVRFYTYDNAYINKIFVNYGLTNISFVK